MSPSDRFPTAAEVHLMVEHERRLSLMLIAEAEFHARVSTAAAVFDAVRRPSALGEYRTLATALRMATGRLD